MVMWDIIQGGFQSSRESSCPIPSDDIPPRMQGTVISQSTPQNSAVWSFFNIWDEDHAIVICSLCLKAYQAWKFYWLFKYHVYYIKRHMAYHDSAHEEQHLNGSHPQEKGHTPPHPSSSFFPPLPHYARFYISNHQ